MSTWKDISDYWIKDRFNLKGLGYKTHISPSNRFDGNIVVNKIDVRPIHRETQGIAKWRAALQQAESTGQQRKKLYDLYADILLDGFLKESIAKRVRAITNRDLTFSVNGKEVEDIVKLTKYSFFETFLREAMLSRFWGHSLLELDWGKDGNGWTKLVDRRHVKPRFGIVTKNSFELTGIQYRKNKFIKHLIEVGEDEDLGLILEVCDYVIYKRGNFGDWAEFAEVFGMPFRWGTYENPESRQSLIDGLDKLGSAGYGVGPADAKIEMIGNGQGNNNDIFRHLRDACNAEISIAILGQTMTTSEAKSSGYAQSKTHMDVQAEIHKDDRKFITRVLNERLTPYLEAIGYNTRQGLWSFVEEENLSKKEKLEIALKVSDKVPVGNTYWYETFGIPKPTADDLPAQQQEPESESKKKA